MLQGEKNIFIPAIYAGKVFCFLFFSIYVFVYLVVVAWGGSLGDERIRVVFGWNKTKTKTPIAIVQCCTNMREIKKHEYGSIK